MPKVCLCMIVKNESKIIERCLNSVKPIMDSLFIVDTGSTDNTVELIKNFIRIKLSPAKGFVVSRPWKNFEHNRNEAIKLAKAHCIEADYLYFIDADEELIVGDPEEWKTLEKDAYLVNYNFGELKYPRISLVKARQNWHYLGVLHEYLTLDTPYTTGTINQSHVHVRPEGARSTDPNKFLNDAQVLRDALLTEPNNERYQFYLAQSLKDAELPEAAIIEYEKRISMGGWIEEVWYSYYQIGKLREYLPGSNPETIIYDYLKAINYRPSRAEAYGRLAKFLRSKEHFTLACSFAEQGMKLPMTEDKLFLEPAYYKWMCRDEYAVSGYWCGKYLEAATINEQLLADGFIPEHEKGRIQDNLKFCLEKLR